MRVIIILSAVAFAAADVSHVVGGYSRGPAGGGFGGSSGGGSGLGSSLGGQGSGSFSSSSFPSGGGGSGSSSFGGFSSGSSGGSGFSGSGSGFSSGSGGSGVSGFSGGSGGGTVTRHVYVHVAPDEPEEQLPSVSGGASSKNVHHKIIFIKAPEYKFSAQQIQAAGGLNEEKTVIYVLSKKPEIAAPQVVGGGSSFKPEKPEVFFIKYKGQEGGAGAGGLGGGGASTGGSTGGSAGSFGPSGSFLPSSSGSSGSAAPTGLYESPRPSVPRPSTDYGPPRLR